MALNKSKGNMYEFVTHTWNPVKGECPHKCTYCYMDAIRHRFNKESKAAYLDESEFNTNLGTGNFIFVGSSNDIFSSGYPDYWIKKILSHCEKFESKYLFQTKNPARVLDYIDACVITDKTVICTTIETNSYYDSIMGNCPLVDNRADAMNIIGEVIDTYVTIEPIMDFDLKEMVHLIKRCRPKQVNIGADSGHNNLPEPSKHKINELIMELSSFTNVVMKPNLNRLLNQ